MKVNQFPAAGLFLPHPGLVAGKRHGFPFAAELLRQADVGDHAHLAQQSDLRLAKGFVHLRHAAAELEIELVESQAFHPLAAGLRLERR